MSNATKYSDIPAIIFRNYFDNRNYFQINNWLNF